LNIKLKHKTVLALFQFKREKFY